MNPNSAIPLKAKPTRQGNLKRLVWLIFAVIVLGILVTAAYFSEIPFPSQQSNKQNAETPQKNQDGQIIPPRSDENPMKLAINEATAADGKLHVAITVENRGNLGFEKLLYYASLIGRSEETKTPEGNILLLQPMPIAQINSAPFPLKSGKIEKFQFDLPYPKGAPVGEYDLNVEVRPMEDTYYALETQKISLSQSGPYLNIPSYLGCRIKVGNTTYDSFNPNITPNEAVNAECDVMNPGKQTIKAKPIVTYAKRSEIRSGGAEVKTIDDLQEISLSPNEKKTVQFTLPPQTTPQIYEAQLQFVGEDSHPLSNYGYVRYTVKGPSPLVNKAELSTSIITKRDLVSLNVLVSPSSDIFFNGKTTEGTLLKQPKLTAKLTSGPTTCAEKTVDLPANAIVWQDVVKMDFKSDSDCWDPLLTLKISEGGQTLTTFQKQYLSSSVSNDFKSNSATNTRSVIWTVLVAVFLIIIVIVLILVMKKKKTANNPLIKLLIFFAATALFFAIQPVKDTVMADIIQGPGAQITVTRGTGPYSVQYFSQSATSTSSTNIHVFWSADVSAPSQWWYMSDKVRIWIDGSLVKEYNYSTQNTGNGHQNHDHNDDIPVSAGQHTVESRLYAVMVGPCCAEQANSGSATSGGSDNNCGSTEPCYGRLGPTTVGAPLCTPTSEQQSVSCSAGQWGTQRQQRDYTCPGGTWSGWYNISTGTTCTTPILTLTATPNSGYAPHTTNLSWNIQSHQPGTTCTNNWNSFLNPMSASQTSNQNITQSGSFNPNISCTDGTSVTAPVTISPLPQPGIALTSNTCSNSTPVIGMNLTAPNLAGTTTKIYVNGLSQLAYSVNLSPNQTYNVNTASFNAPYNNPTPNTGVTYYAVTSMTGKTDSAASSFTVTAANCPSSPAITSAAASCVSQQPRVSVAYNASTYGSPSNYYLDRNPPNGNIMTAAPGTNPIIDSGAHAYGILNNTTYVYSMRAGNALATSTSSNTSSPTTLNCTPPAVTVTKNTCIGNNPDVDVTITAPGNAGISMNHTLQMISPSSANLAVRAIAPSASTTVNNTSFAAPYNVLNSQTAYTVQAYSTSSTSSPAGASSFTTLECNGPKPFSLSLNNTQPICPADGLPRLNLSITKSTNAEFYHIITKSKDADGNYTIEVPGAVEYNVPAATLFPGAATTVSKSYSVPPNAQYSVTVIAFKNSTGSYIYSNVSTMNTTSFGSETPWLYPTFAWCDTQAPQITMMSLLQDCYQPDTWTTAQPIRTLVQDLPKSNAPANSVSGIKDVKYSLDPQGATNYQYPATNTSGNYYDRTFDNSVFSSGQNRFYSLGAQACDNATPSNCTTLTKKDFLYTNICTGWIQTRGGNVHSEGNINAPGGPQ